MNGDKRDIGLQVIYDVMDERTRQDKKWGEQNHSDEKWLSVLVEEVGEAAQAINKLYVDPVREQSTNDTDKWQTNLENEVIEIAAVAIAWVECRRRNRA